MSTWAWATVTGVNPLRIQMDTDTTPLSFTPQTLIDPSILSIGDRVRCESSGRRIIIHGKSATVSTPTMATSFPGEIRAYAGSSPPVGWLKCDGAAISRTTYPNLFATLGTTWGAGNGSTTFNLPNLKGRVPVGLDTAQTEFASLGKTGGAKTHTLTVAEMPSHSHDVGGNGAINDGGVGELYSVQNGTYYGFRASEPASTGGGQGHNNLAPYATVNWIIRY